MKKIHPSSGRGSILPHGPGFRAELMVDGKRARQTFKTVEEADAWLTRLVKLSRYGVGLDKTTTTVKELFDSFYESKELANRKQATLGNYKNYGRHLNEMLGTVLAQQLTVEHVQKFLSRLKAKGFSNRHIYGIWAALVGVLDYGINVVEILDRNVARRVKPPKPGNPEHKMLPRESIEPFLEAITDVRDQALFHVLLFTGMRRGELVGLKWSDLDLKTGRLIIQRRIIRDPIKKGFDISDPKTEAGLRVNMLPPVVLRKVLEWSEVQEKEREVFASVWHEDGYIFTSRHVMQRGEHMDPASVNWMLDKYLAKAGLPHVNVHGLRHSFCTWLLNDGANVRDVQQIVGHAKPSITLDMYWRAVKGAEERVSDAASRLLTPQHHPEPTDFPSPAPRKGLRRVV